MAESHRAKVRIEYFGKSDVPAEVVTWRGGKGATLTIDAVPDFIRDEFGRVAYTFLDETILRVDLFNPSIPNDTGLVVIVKKGENVDIKEPSVFVTPENAQDYSGQMIQAGYVAIQHALTTIPAYIPNPILPRLEAIAATSIKR